MKDSTILKRTRIEGSVHKRVPQRAAAAVTDIYISRKSKIPVIINRIRQLMVNEKQSIITIHGMGAMLCRAIVIAQKAQSKLENQVDLRLTTSTVTLIDDIVPEDMDEDIQTQQRQNSAVKIDLVAKPGLSDLQKKTPMIARHPARNRKLRR